MQNQPFRKLPIAYRAYDLPQYFPVIAFLGKSWTVNDAQPQYLHFHNCIEIGFCFSGGGHIHLPQSCASYAENDFVILFANVPHMTTSTGASNWEYIYFSPQALLEQLNLPYDSAFLASFSVQSAPVHVTKQDAPVFYRLLQQLFTEFHRKETLYESSVQGLLLGILPYLRRASVQQAEFRSGHAQLETIFNCLSYIHKNYHKPLNTPDLAAACYLSETHFRRVFKEIVGIAPQEYIELYRIHQACHLFFTNQSSIQSIAHAVGFPTISSFNRQFQKCMNMSPSAWRKQNLQLATIHEVRNRKDLDTKHILR